MRRRWLACFWLALGLAALLWAAAQNPQRSQGGWLHPLRALVASVEWTRFHAEVGQGQWQEAYVRARRALRWDPGSPEGWSTLAHHFLFRRASAENEPDPERRVAWLARGLHVLREGQKTSFAPAELWLAEGQTLTLWIAGLAEEEDLPWPGGGEAAWQLGLQRLQRALEAQHPQAPLVLELARKVGRENGWRPGPP